MRLGSVAAIADLQVRAHARVPRDFMDYYESGSYAEQTLAANRDDFAKIRLRQRVLVGASDRSSATTLIGQPTRLPIALAPIGLLGMAWRDGEIAAARAAERAGIPCALSTMSICSIEDVAAATKQPFWFQLYFMRDRGFVASLIDRAKAAGCSALVLTVDLQVLGQRHRDVRNGLSVPPRIRIDTLARMAMKPRWVYGVLTGKRRAFGNLDGHVQGMEDVRSLSEWTARQFDQALDWDDVAWVRERWPGKLIIKGILDVEDARAAARSGADAIVVSNHGGRQLDGAPSAISQLPRIAEAVGADVEVLFDSGIRSGQDVFRALALGARGCLLGRAYLYGIAAAGENGAAKAIDIIARELDTTMALTGARTVADITPDRLVGEW